MELDELYELIDNQPLSKVFETYPAADNFLRNNRLDDIDRSLPLIDGLKKIDPLILEEFDLTPADYVCELAEYIAMLPASRESPAELGELMICPGVDKDGRPEQAVLVLHPGEVVSLVGPTGSGKSRLLGDIECLAQGDTPSKRRIMLDGRFPGEEERMALSCSLIALLSQNMNFVVDLTAAAFLRLHAESRGRAEPDALAAACVTYANGLSGEAFGANTRLAQLSGGQSRALMIADAALISDAPIILIDEIENAGIDREKAVSMLIDEKKAVLISTHDPLLALSASRRAVMKNGAISAILTPSAEETALLPEIRRMDERLTALRNRLRNGEQLGMGKREAQ